MGLQTQVRASYLVCRLCLLSPVLRQKWKAKTLKRTAWVCFQTSPLASSAFTRPGQRKLALILLCSLSYLFMLLFLGTLLKRISRTPSLWQTVFYKSGFDNLSVSNVLPELCTPYPLSRASPGVPSLGTGQARVTTSADESPAEVLLWDLRAGSE